MTDRARRIYLDYNATAPLLPEARRALVDALETTGNPSSVHGEGRRARALVEDARRSVAALVGATAEAVVFTSGATEAANTLLTPEWIDGTEGLRLEGLAVPNTDHACTRDGGRFDAGAVHRLPVDAAGQLKLEALDAWLAGLGGSGAAMLCLALANNETGVIQALEPVQRRLEGTGVLLVLDAVQAAGRLPCDMSQLGADALFLSGHKIGAAKGVGAYIFRDASRRPMPLLTGGGQERRHRAGTEAVPLIASFGAAAGVAAGRLARAGELAALRDRLATRLRQGGFAIDIPGEESPRLPNTLSVSSPGLGAETVQIALDLSGFAVSSGSACSSGKVGPSHVLQALRQGGASVDPAQGAIRVSFGYETTQDELDLFTEAFLAILARSRSRQDGRKAA